jgi:ligand-binding SRPBCC domain-containing protein
MPTFSTRSRMPASAEAAFAWHTRPGALERLLPPWGHTRVLDRTGGVADGGRVTLELHLGPVPIRWVARHTDFEPGVMFRDEQEEGPFARWVHTHRVHPLDATSCELEDTIDYELPLGPLGHMGATPWSRACWRACSRSGTPAPGWTWSAMPPTASIVPSGSPSPAPRA